MGPRRHGWRIFIEHFFGDLDAYAVKNPRHFGEYYTSRKCPKRPAGKQWVRKFTPTPLIPFGSGSELELLCEAHSWLYTCRFNRAMIRYAAGSGIRSVRYILGEVSVGEGSEFSPSFPIYLEGCSCKTTMSSNWRILALRCTVSLYESPPPLSSSWVLTSHTHVVVDTRSTWDAVREAR